MVEREPAYAAAEQLQRRERGTRCEYRPLEVSGRPTGRPQDGALPVARQQRADPAALVVPHDDLYRPAARVYRSREAGMEVRAVQVRIGRPQPVPRVELFPGERVERDRTYLRGPGHSRPPTMSALSRPRRERLSSAASEAREVRRPAMARSASPSTTAP